MNTERPGQALFYALWRLDPEFAQTINGTELDPFHDDSRIDDTLRAWRNRLMDTRAL